MEFSSWDIENFLKASRDLGVKEHARTSQVRDVRLDKQPVLETN